MEGAIAALRDSRPAGRVALVVNEMLPGGWLEFLGHVRLRDDQAFDRQEVRDLP